MESKEAPLSSSSPVSDLKIDGDNSSSFTVVSDDDDVFLNAQEEPVAEELVGGANSVDVFESSPVFDVSVNGDGENLNKSEVLEAEKDAEKEEALLEDKNRDVEESSGSGSIIQGGSADSEKVDEVTEEVHDAVENESVGGFGTEEFQEASSEKSTPNHLISVNDDVENLDKDNVWEGEKAVDLVMASSSLEEEEEEEEKPGSITDNRFSDSTIPIAETSGLNPNAIEVQSDGLEESKVSSENADETVNPIRDRSDEEKVEEEELEGETIVEEAKDVGNLEINGADEIKQFDPSSEEKAVIAESINRSDESDPVASSESVHSNGRLPSIQNDMEDETASGFSVSPKKISSEECKEEANHQVMTGDGELEDGSVSDQDSDGMGFGSSEAARQFIKELERESDHAEASALDGQVESGSEEGEEMDTDEEGDGHQLLDSSAIAALLQAADRGNITITSPDGSRLFSVERPAGLGSSLRSLAPTAQPARSNFFTPTLSNAPVPEENLTEEEKRKLERLQQIRVKFLRLVKRLGFSSDDSIATQVLYRLSLIAGKSNSQLFSMDAARSAALQLETEGGKELDLSVNILVLGKCGVGKSSTINSILEEEKAKVDAFLPTTTDVKEICVTIHGVKVRIFDTPALKSSAMDQSFNNKVLANVKKLAKKNPVDILLYVDRLDTQTRDLNDLPLLRTITASLGSSIWRSAIVTLTHAASAPPEGPTGSPMSYEAFVTQRSRVVQQSIGHATGDIPMVSQSMMIPVSLVENHPACRRNRDGQKILPNGQVWRPQLLLLCFSMKILSEANSFSKSQDLFDPRKILGFRTRSPPLPYMLSSMLQSRPHPKLTSDNVDSEVDLDDLSDSDQEGGEEEDYEKLPPFKPLRKAQIAKLSKEQKRAYFEEYDYRVKLLQKKQWREELKRMKEMKKKGAGPPADEDLDSGAAAPVAVPLPDMVLPPSFDGDNPTYRYRFLEPSSLFLARPVLDNHGWDHDCGYEGVNIEHGQAVADRYPTAVTFQISKDKKDFSVSLESSISAKHGDTGSSMAGFDIQNIGKQLAYVVRGETKFKNLKKNKTAGGVSVTFVGENLVTGVKLEDQVTLGKRFVLVGSTGTVRSRSESAYGANFELQRREADYPIGQVQSTVSASVIKWRNDLALGLNALTQFSVGRNSKVAVRVGINNKMSGQVSVRTSSSDNLSIALAALLPVAVAAYRKFYPAAAENYSIY